MAISLCRIETSIERESCYRNYIAALDARHLQELTGWREIKVLDPKSRRRVPNAIWVGFESKPTEFHFMNRGLVLGAEQVHDSKAEGREK